MPECLLKKYRTQRLETILCSVHLPHHNYINYFLGLETPILISKGQVFQIHMWTDEENTVSRKLAGRIISTCLQGCPGACGPCGYAQQISLVPGLHLCIPNKWSLSVIVPTVLTVKLKSMKMSSYLQIQIHASSLEMELKGLNLGPYPH